MDTSALRLATTASVFLLLVLCWVHQAVSESDVTLPSSVPPENVEDLANLSGEGLFPGEEEAENRQSQVVQERRPRSSTSLVLGKLFPRRFSASSLLTSKVLVAVTMVLSAVFLLYRVGNVVLDCLEEAGSQTSAGSTPRSLSGAEGHGLNECIEQGVRNVETGGSARGSVYSARKDKRQKLVTVAALFVLAVGITIGVIFFNMTGQQTGGAIGATGGVAALGVLSAFAVALQAGYSFWRLKYNTHDPSGKAVGRGMFPHYIALAFVVLLAIILPIVQNQAGGVYWFSLALVPLVLFYLASPYLFGGKKKNRDTGI